MLLTGERAAIGPLRRDLVPHYTRWVNDLEVRRGAAQIGLHTEDAQLRWYEEMSAASAEMHPKRAIFTVYDRRDETPVGTSSLFAVNYRMGTAHLGIGLGERRGEGLGTEATQLTARWAFEVLGLHHVSLEAADWNVAAIRAYEKAGFKLVGRRRGAMVTGGVRCDEVLMDAVAPDFT
ncbi:MAG TPA: GNAT family protein [Solirubrobacteraceae bacterium]|jgi:RimJ/RimL family protein N-acetyltransferase